MAEQKLETPPSSVVENPVQTTHEAARLNVPPAAAEHGVTAVHEAAENPTMAETNEQLEITHTAHDQPVGDGSNVNVTADSNDKSTTAYWNEIKEEQKQEVTKSPQHKESWFQTLLEKLIRHGV